MGQNKQGVSAKALPTCLFCLCPAAGRSRTVCPALRGIRSTRKAGTSAFGGRASPKAPLRRRRNGAQPSGCPAAAGDCFKRRFSEILCGFVVIFTTRRTVLSIFFGRRSTAFVLFFGAIYGIMTTSSHYTLFKPPFCSPASP